MRGIKSFFKQYKTSLNTFKNSMEIAIQKLNQDLELEENGDDSFISNFNAVKGNFQQLLAHIDDKSK